MAAPDFGAGRVGMAAGAAVEAPAPPWSLPDAERTNARSGDPDRRRWRDGGGDGGGGAVRSPRRLRSLRGSGTATRDAGPCRAQRCSHCVLPPRSRERRPPPCRRRLGRRPGFPRRPLLHGGVRRPPRRIGALAGPPTRRVLRPRSTARLGRLYRAAIPVGRLSGGGSASVRPRAVSTTAVGRSAGSSVNEL